MSLQIIPHIKKIGNRHILYDAGSFPEPDIDFFCPQRLQEKNMLVARAKGRGEAYFFKHGDQEWVLRHCLRGGFMARILSDQYLGWNLEKSRSWAEWRLLADLYALGLPVPKPVAASVTRGAGFYRADLITNRIPQAIPLAHHLSLEPLSAEVWERIGVCLRRFHDAGVYHADLNASNILLGERVTPYLIDFDRGLRHRSGIKGTSNIKRLHRSLLKFKKLSTIFHFGYSEWELLLQGYSRNR